MSDRREQELPPGSAPLTERNVSAISVPGAQTTSLPQASRSPPTKDPLLRTPSSPQLVGSHRHSFADNLRGMPPSPRAHRQPSLSQQAFQELLNMPPIAKSGNAEFKDKDWRTTTVGDVTDPELVRFAELETSVEDATNLLVTSGPPNVILIRENESSKSAVSFFDYNDLNAYLLLVVGFAKPEEKQVELFNEIVQKAKAQEAIPLRMVKGISRKEGLTTLPDTAHLTKATELFGSGVHRIVIVKENTMDVVGVLTQLRLVQFFWENSRHFESIARLYPQYLKDLEIGSHTVVAINGDKPLTDALEIMYNEGITSLPVLDNQRNVIGNISHVDVRLLTKTTSFPLLRSSCIHFISVILSERGVNDGKDPFPVFYVSPYSTLAHTVAKLVATRSHRMWVVDSPSPSSSGPSTPALTASVPHGPSPVSSSFLGSAPQPPAQPHTYLSSPPPAHPTGPPYTPAQPPHTTVSAGSIPGGSISGHLNGVVSLTDVLNLFARASGLSPHDPNETRRQRRRSSSVSVSSVGGGWRRSVDSGRSEEVFGMDRPGAGQGGPGQVVSRNGSVSGRRY